VAVVVLDAGAVSAFADADRVMRERIRRLLDRSGDPFIVPAGVVVESTTGHAGRDATVNRFLHGCEIAPLSELIARRAAALRFGARAGSAVDAMVVATAESRGGGVVLTGDVGDLAPLATQSRAVAVLPLP
jgi:predicted nucleic acid-binding protein